MKINIKQIDIDRGTFGDSTNCPIARALKRQFNTKHILVTGPYASIRGTHFNLPTKARQFVQFFDRHFDVSPFSFSIKIKTTKVGMANVNKKVSLLTK